MRPWYQTRCVFALLALSVVLAGCGVPGVTVDAPAPSRTVRPTRVPNVDATVAAQVNQTVAAQTAATEEAEASTPSAAATATAVATPTRAATATPVPVTPTETATGEVETAGDAAGGNTEPQREAVEGASGDGTVVVVGQDGTGSLLTQGQWSAGKLSASGVCNDANALFDAADTAWLQCNGDLFTSGDGGASWNEFAGYSIQAARDPQGRIWSIKLDSIEVIENGTVVATYAVQDATQEQEFPTNAATFAPDGTLWLGGSSFNDRSSLLVSFDGTNWTTYGSEIMPSQNAIHSLFVNTQGELFAGVSGVVYKLQDGAFVEAITRDQFEAAVDYVTAGDIRSFANPSDDQLYMATPRGIVVWNGTDLRHISTDDGLPSNNVFDLAIDEAGRIWAATAYGIAVQSGEGWEVAVPSTSGLATSHTLAISVRGAPTLPAPDSTVKSGAVAGQATLDGKALAGAELQLCSEPQAVAYRSTVAGATPCEQQFYSQLVQADDEGRFRFESVPLGTYGIAVRPADGEWATVTLIGDFITVSEPDEEVIFNLDL